MIPNSERNDAMLIAKVDATTWFVFARQDGPKMGTINYPGNHPTLNYHAVYHDSTDLGHFATKDEAATAIMKKQTGVIVSTERFMNDKAEQPQNRVTIIIDLDPGAPSHTVDDLIESFRERVANDFHDEISNWTFERK